MALVPVVAMSDNYFKFYTKLYLEWLVRKSGLQQINLTKYTTQDDKESMTLAHLFEIDKLKTVDNVIKLQSINKSNL